MRVVVAPLIVASFLLAAPTAVQAQVESREGIALQNQIYQLRQELRAAEDQMSHAGGPIGRAPAYSPPPQQGGNDLLTQLLTRVDTLEDQVRQLRGRIDEMQNQLQKQNDDLGKRIDDLAFQVNPQGANRGPSPNAESAAFDANNPAPPPRSTSSPARPAAPAHPRTPEATLQEGNAALARRDFSGAESAARQVLANRTSPRAYDARLLLAQALYGQHQYAQAAISFDDAYNSSRKGSHAQDALLGLANSLFAINEKKAACDTLTRLRTDFPKPRPDIAAATTATSQKTGCH